MTWRCDAGHSVDGQRFVCTEGWEDGTSWTTILCSMHAATHAHTGNMPCTMGGGIAVDHVPTKVATVVPDGRAPGTYALVREYFVANYMDGDDGCTVTQSGAALADEIAEMFSSAHWRAEWNKALMRDLRDRHGTPPTTDAPGV